MEYILDEKGYRLHGNANPIRYIIENDCWICVSYNNQSEGGHIKISRNGKGIGLHRYAYELYKEDIPSDLIVRHTCHKPKCINPAHLIIGTHKENTQDMVNANRSKPSKECIEKRKESLKKLTNEQALEIKKMLINKELNQQQIADRFNINRRLIGLIKKGESVYSEFLKGGIKEWLK